MRHFYFKIFILLSSIFATEKLCAQQTYLPLHAPEYHLLDRLETFTGKVNTHFNSAQKPISRKDAVTFLSEVERLKTTRNFTLSSIDDYDMRRAISISGEWYENAQGMDGSIDSKRPILRHFYKKQADFLHFNTDNFFLVVNPVLYLQAGYQKSIGTKMTNTRGLELRGRIADKVGFYTMLADNQESVPQYVEDWIQQHKQQFPGIDYSVRRGKNHDIFLARGYIDFSLLKEHIAVTFGYDKNVVGNGLRSLVLSGNAAPSTFLRLRSRWGKFTYENLYTEMVADNFLYLGLDTLVAKKYGALHQLSYTPVDWLNIGIFESSVLGKKSGIPLEVLVPVIGYQSAAKALGAHNNTAWGFNFKAIALRQLQIYGQAFVNNINFGKLGKASWENQYAAQLGLKYFDVANIANLDLQVEGNFARPFTYSGFADSTTSFTHYIQPLAHPLGNNFAEIIGVLQYQPFNKWYLTAKAIYSVSGRDTGNSNLGNSIYKIVEQRTNGNNAYPFLGGEKVKTLYANLHASYELRPNLFLELGGTYLDRKKGNISLPTTIFAYGGLRWNISRKEYDFQ